MKHRIAALAVAVICLISAFTIPCFAAETQPASTQPSSVQATIESTAGVPATQTLTEAPTIEATVMPTYNSPIRGLETEALTENAAEATEAVQATEVTEEPEAPDTGKAIVIGLACILLGGIIAGCIIYHKRKNDDGSDEE